MTTIGKLVTRERIAVIVVALALVVAGCSAGGGDAAQGGGDGSAAQAGGDGDAAANVGSYYDDDGNRVVVREASMRVRVSDFQESFAEVRRIVQESGGYLGDRSQRGEGDWDAGEVTIHVPAERFGDVRGQIADLGRVEREEVNVLDFTEEHRDRASRLSQLREDERRLERVLNRTDNASEATRLWEELQSVRDEIESLESDQEQLERRATMSTITLDMHEPVEKKPPDNYVTVAGFSSAFWGAFAGGLGLLQSAVAFVGWAIPATVALLLGLGFVVGAAAGGRRLLTATFRYLDAEFGRLTGETERDPEAGLGPVEPDDGGKGNGPGDGDGPGGGDGSPGDGDTGADGGDGATADDWGDVESDGDNSGERDGDGRAGENGDGEDADGPDEDADGDDAPSE